MGRRLHLGLEDAGLGQALREGEGLDLVGSRDRGKRFYLGRKSEKIKKMDHHYFFLGKEMGLQGKGVSFHVTKLSAHVQT